MRILAKAMIRIERVMPIRLLLSLTILLGLMGTVSEVKAFPFIEVEGFVYPFSEGTTITDNGDGTTTFSEIDYIFSVAYSAGGAEMNFLSLEFENDIFFSMGSINNLDPTDWAALSVSSPGSSYQVITAGTTLGMGEKLKFSISDVTLYNLALRDPNLWQEGQIWAQSWRAGDTLGGGDGGSTAVPEPASLMLLGSGLVVWTLGRRVWRP